MKRSFTLSGLIAVLLFLASAIAAQQNPVIPRNYQVDTRVDNMGYWRKCAELGLAPVQPMSKPAPAKNTGSRVFHKGVLIQDSPDVPVTTDNTTTQSENSIVVDPFDKDNVLNSNNSTPNPSNGSVYGTSTYSTTDGGSSWSGTKNGPGGSNSGDPAACINLNGRWFIGYINNGSGQSVSYSDNQGASWTVSLVANSPSGFGNMLDKNHLWVDASPTSTFPGYLYDAWTTFGGSNDSEIGISASSTNGASWSAVQHISSAVNAGSHNQGVNLKTGPNGEAYCVWTIYDSWPSDEKALGFSKSLDGGVTWSPAVRIINNLKGIRTTGIGKNMRVNSFPCMAVDISNGPRRGTIYVVWANIGVPGTNVGPDVDIYLIKSTDQGATWTSPVKVNQDATGLGKKHYMPWITCDQASGTVSIVFYDDRNVASNQTEVYMAWSTDGCATFEDIKVSDISFTPAPIPLMASQYMGDYLGISAYNGRTYPCWTDNRLGYCMTYTSPIDLIIPKALVVYDNNFLNDTTFGNGNNKMDFGEIELLGLKMKNTGNAASDSVTVTLSSLSPYITFEDASEFYGDFAQGQAKTIMGGFKFHVSDSIPGLTLVPFEVQSHDKFDSVTTSTFQLLSHGPALSINLLTVSDPAPGGNNNGRLDPGETATLMISTENTGDYDAVEVMSELMTTNPYVTVNSASYSIGTLTPGQIVSATFNITVSSAAYHGSAARFYNTAHGGFQRTAKDFLLKIGLVVEDWETAGFQKFNWIQGGDANWVIDPDVKWEGNYSAHSGTINAGQTSVLKINYNALYDDSISFYRKISTKGLSNFLKFYIDGNMVGTWSGSGNQNWIYAAYPVLAGPHEFKWVYDKPFAAGTDQDKVWVDFIVFPPEFKVAAFAGSNASVCAGTNYQLQGLAMNYDSLNWVTSGNGNFNDAHILNPIYTPSAEDIAAGTVTLTIHAYGQPNIDTTSSLILTIVPQPTGNAGDDAAICAGSTFELSTATATNYGNLVWSTSGDGTFSNAGTLHPVYTPGTQDKQTGSALLSLSVTPTSVECQEITDAMNLTIHANPVVNLGADKTVYADVVVTLDATSTGATSYLWHPSNATTPTINVDTTGIGTGKQTISVTVTNQNGCTASDTIHVTFEKKPEGIETLKNVTMNIYPNPGNGNFMMELTAKRAEILNIRVIDASGVTVHSIQGLEVTSGISKQNMDISFLAQGTFFIEISNGTGSLIRKVVIKK